MDVFVIGPGERGQELIYPERVTATFEQAQVFVRERWSVELEPHVTGNGLNPTMWSGKRERFNPVDLIFVYRVPMETS